MGDCGSSLRDRFRQKYVEHPSGCWLWTAYRNRSGYGQISIGGRHDGRALAHRVSWELHRGPVPRGLCVLHRCDVPACVNPDHLFIGTNAENMSDMARKGRANPCGGRWLRGEEHPNAKLNRQLVAMIRSSSKSTRALAREIGVDRRTVSLARRGITWRSAG